MNVAAFIRRWTIPPSSSVHSLSEAFRVVFGFSWRCHAMHFPYFWFFPINVYCDASQQTIGMLGTFVAFPLLVRTTDSDWLSTEMEPSVGNGLAQ